MKFSSSLLSALLGASTALAAPQRLGARSSLSRSFPKQPASSPKASLASDGVDVTNSTDTDTSNNWSGAVLVGSGYTTVTGTLVVPEIPSSSSSTQKSGSAWVGIDGDTCQSLWQTGISWYVTGDDVTYDAWYEWVPYSASVTFDDFSVSAGDTIVMTVTSTSTTSGTATLENQTTGKKATHTYSSMSSEYALCNVNAEWIVEDFSLCLDSSCTQTQLAPFADYGTAEFTDCSVVQSGETTDISGATLIDLVNDSDEVVSSCSESSSTVTCKYESDE